MGLSLVFPPARRSPLRLYADLPRASAVDKVPEDPLGDEPGRLAGGKAIKKARLRASRRLTMSRTHISIKISGTLDDLATTFSVDKIHKIAALASALQGRQEISTEAIARQLYSLSESNKLAKRRNPCKTNG